MSVNDWHPSEDDLTLSLSGDESSSLGAPIVEHLRTCQACRADRDEIAAVLALVSASRVPDAGPDFEARMWARIQPALGSNSAPRRWGVRQIAPTLAWAAAIGGIVIAGYAALPRLAPSPAPATVTTPGTATDSAASTAKERVLLAAVDAHLSKTEMLFVELLNAPTASASEMAFAQTTAGDLVSSGRLYRETAREAGDVPVGLVLDDLLPVLVEVARAPERSSGQDLAALRDRIESEDLLFKVRAVTVDIRARQNEPSSPRGEL